MEQGWSTRRVVGLGAAGLLAVGLTACSASADRAEPGPTVTVREVQIQQAPQVTVTVTATPAADEAARLKAVGDEAARVSVPPPGAQVGVYQEDKVEWYLWPTPDGRVCYGLYVERVTVSCGRALPAAPAATIVLGPQPLEDKDQGWVVFVVADGEELLSLRCGPGLTEPREVRGFATVGSPRRLYAAEIHGVVGLKADVRVGGQMSAFQELQSVVPADPSRSSGDCGT